MMGKTHSATGLLAGLAVAPLLGLHQPAEIGLFAVTGAGFALLPDLDHPTSRASMLLGPVTERLSDGVRALSAWMYRMTRRPRDDRGEGTHRHLSHTFVFAGVLGELIAWAGSAWGPWFVLAILLFGLLLAQDALGDWIALAAFVAGAILVIQGDLFGALGSIGGWIGFAVTLGCVVHCLGDALTLSGCPFLWPIPIRGEAWFELGPPKVVRFRTGGWFEGAVVMPATMLGALLLCPLLGPWVLGLLGGLAS
jgi:membrane-bound metal-dependent hydrolase YbcI (DUF457 family)